MTISSAILSVMISTALVLTIAAPILLLVLLILDWKKGRLW
jgi:ABC-type transport system involved in cytochrome bd biosynthesis fused ATPase/permease subunit